jgi:pyruvate carboxylase
VLGYLAGELGTPPAGFPEPFRTKAVAGAPEELPEVALDPRTTPPLDGPQRRRSCRGCCSPARGRTTRRRSPQHGDVSMIPTEAVFYGLEPGGTVPVCLEAGVEVLVELQTGRRAVARTAMRTLHVRVNGQPRPVQVRDRSVQVQGHGRRRADPGDPAPRRRGASRSGAAEGGGGRPASPRGRRSPSSRR